MEIQIKKFQQLTVDQLYQILKLRVDAFVVEQKCAYPELDDNDQKAVHLFAEADGKVKAYLRLHFPETGKAKISRVVTASDFRGKGASRELVDAALASLEKEEQITSVFLQSQEYLTRFYGSFGFEKISEVYLEDDIPHVDMELSLK